MPVRPMVMVSSDWTERHRPTNEHMLEGNEAQRRRIRTWLESWELGVPERRGLLLVGPPGVGKTTIARAIANDKGWQCVELNASDARNAATLRSKATSSTQHRSLFAGEDGRTLVLLDEVDHLSGGLRSVSEDRIREANRSGTTSTLKGDHGGKAEVLHLLSSSQMPVILACNDEMGLWGRSNWRSTKDRFMRHLVRVEFNRVSKEAMMRIAQRIARSEDLNIDDQSLRSLVQGNPGDLRSMIRDLEALATGRSLIQGTDVRALLEVNERDRGLEIFPGLEALYQSRDAIEATRTMRHLDRSPDDLTAWVHWNNSVVSIGREAAASASSTLAVADRMLMGRFRNTAHRSWYWASHLAAMAASVVQDPPVRGRIKLTYPDFLRYRWSGTSGGLTAHLAETFSTSEATVRDTILPILHAVHRASEVDHESFEVSIGLGLDAEDHVGLCGLPRSAASTKRLMQRYRESQERMRLADVPEEETGLGQPPDDEHSKEEGIQPPDGQSTLF